MEIDKCPVDIPCIPQSAFMLEAHFCKATPGRNIAPLNDGIDSMQVIPGQCHSGETGDRQGSQSFVPILFFANDHAYFAASMGGINMFERTVADEHFISIHREEFMLSSGKVLRIPRLDCFERQDALPQIAVDRRIISPMNNFSQTVGWKIVDGQVVHGWSFRSKQPEHTDDRSEGTPYTTGSMAYCPNI